MRLLGLRLRSWLGWGEHPSMLRWHSAWLMKAFTRVFIPGALLLSLMIVVASVLPFVERYHSLPSHVTPDLIRLVLVLEIFLWLVGIIFVLLPAVSRRNLARRGDASQISRVYGRCFAVLLAPGFDEMFARIGASRETARWYRFPLAWDRVVAPSEDQLELDVLETTGWVERVRRSGGVPGEMSQPAPTEEELRAAPTRSATPDAVREAREEMRRELRGDASEEERKELRRYARRAGFKASQTPRQIAVNAWSLVLGGIVFTPAWPALYIVVGVLYPASMYHRADDGVGLGVAAIFTIVGLCCIWYAVKLLRLSRRLRRLDEAPPESMAGKILCWTPYGGGLIKLRAVDGRERIFLIPVRYGHRVRRRGAWVRVTYQPVSERVLDVAYVEEPVHAAREEAPIPD